MNVLYRLSLAAVVFAICASAQAQCIPYGVYSAIELIDRPHPQANLFPQGGWTLYPGEAGSGVPSCSPYSAVSAVMPPALYAAQVSEKLRNMGIPITPPTPQFLGRNPRIADNVQLPTPKGWLPKEEEKKEDEASNTPPKKKEKGKDNEKGKDKEKQKDNDKEKGNDKEKNPEGKSGKEPPLDEPKIENGSSNKKS